MTAEPAGPPCGERPYRMSSLACILPEGHDGRHESEAHWWHECQQTPVRFGHIHSDELFCMPVCPGYRKGVPQG